MIAVSQYKVVQLTPDERPHLEQVQHLLDTYAREGWELVTSFQCQYEGTAAQPVDEMTRSLSNPTSTAFIFKRAA